MCTYIAEFHAPRAARTTLHPFAIEMGSRRGVYSITPPTGPVVYFRLPPAPPCLSAPSAASLAGASREGPWSSCSPSSRGPSRARPSPSTSLKGPGHPLSKPFSGIALLPHPHSHSHLALSPCYSHPTLSLSPSSLSPTASREPCRTHRLRALPAPFLFRSLPSPFLSGGLPFHVRSGYLTIPSCYQRSRRSRRN